MEIFLPYHQKVVVFVYIVVVVGGGGGVVGGGGGGVGAQWFCKQKDPKNKGSNITFMTNNLFDTFQLQNDIITLIYNVLLCDNLSLNKQLN